MVNVVQGIPETTMDDEARAVLMTELDELNDLMLKSVGKDQSEVIRKRKHVESLINNFGIGVGLMQNELDKYKEVMADNAVNGILTSTDPRYIEGLNAMLNKNGKGWNMSAVDGNWIMSYTNEKGEEVPINLQNFRNAVENTGFGLVKYTKDKSPEYVNIMKASPGYNQINALTQEIIEAEQKGLTKVVITKKKDLQQAIDNLRQDLTNNVTIQASIDENDWQNFAVDPNEVWAVNDPKKQADQRIKTQQAVVEYLMNQAFPNDAQGKIVNEILTSREEKVGAPMTQSQAADFRYKNKKLNAQLQQVQRQYDDVRQAVDYDLNRNILHARQALDLANEENGSMKKANELVKLINEAEPNVGAKTIVGYIDKDGNLVEGERNGKVEYVVLDKTNEPILGLDTFTGIVEYLNDFTITDARVTQKETLDKYRPYIKKRLQLEANAQLAGIEKAKDKEEVKVGQGDDIFK